MSALLFVLGLGLAVVAAARSTYSPCGLSMLSTITPFSERGRGHRYYVTSAWFVVGAVAGGATLGALAAGLAAGLSVSGLTGESGAVAALVGAAALIAAAVDGGIFGEVIPVIRRQVDDRWLARYRPWFYGAGFGWQVGVGVATYVMTAGVFLLVGMAALTGSALDALVICATFGLARGLTVFLTVAAPDPARLRALHARLNRLGPTVRGGVIVIQVAVAALVIGRESMVAGLAVLVAAGAVVAVRVLRPARLVWPPRLRLGGRRVT